MKIAHGGLSPLDLPGRTLWRVAGNAKDGEGRWRGEKNLDAAHWVGAMTRGAEGSLIQLPCLLRIAVRRDLGRNMVISRRLVPAAASARRAPRRGQIEAQREPVDP